MGDEEDPFAAALLPDIKPAEKPVAPVDTGVDPFAAALLPQGEVADDPYAGVPASPEEQPAAVKAAAEAPVEDQVSRQRGRALRAGQDLNPPAEDQVSRAAQRAEAAKERKTDILGKVADSAGRTWDRLKEGDLVGAFTENMKNVASAPGAYREALKEGSAPGHAIQYLGERDDVRKVVAAEYRRDHGIKPDQMLSPKQMHAIEEATDARYKSSRKQEADVGFVEGVGLFWDAVKQDPAKAMKTVVNQMLLNPHEMAPMFQELGLARVVKSTSTAGAALRGTVRAADAAVMGGAIAAADSVAEQLHETGGVSKQKTFNDAMMAAALTGAMQPLMGAAVAAIGAASKSGGTGGIDFREGVIQAQKDIANGMTPEEAVRRVLDTMKIPKDKADAILKGLDDAKKEAADAEAKVADDAKQEAESFAKDPTGKEPAKAPEEPPATKPPPEAKEEPTGPAKPPDVEEIEIKPPKEDTEEIEAAPPPDAKQMDPVVAARDRMQERLDKSTDPAEQGRLRQSIEDLNARIEGRPPVTLAPDPKPPAGESRQQLQAQRDRFQQMLDKSTTPEQREFFQKMVDGLDARLARHPPEPARPPGTPPGTPPAQPPPPRAPPPTTVSPPPPPGVHTDAPVHPIEHEIRNAFEAQLAGVPPEAWKPVSDFMRNLQSVYAQKQAGKRGKTPTLGEFKKAVQSSNLPDIFKALTAVATDGVEHLPVTVGRMKQHYAAKYRLWDKIEDVNYNPLHLDPNAPIKSWYMMTHEGSHARIAAFMDANPAAPAVIATKRLFDYIKGRYARLPADARGKYKHAYQKHHPYGLTNIHEFYAELGSNRQFMDEIRSFELPDTLVKEIRAVLGEKDPGALKTVWQAATKLFGKLLGLPSEKLRAYSVAYDLMSRVHREATPAMRKQSIAALRARYPGGKVFANVVEMPQRRKGEADELIATHGWRNADEAKEWMLDDRSHGDEYLGDAAGAIKPEGDTGAYVRRVLERADAMRKEDAALDAKFDDALVGRAGPEDAPKPKDLSPDQVASAVELAHGNIVNIMSRNQRGAIDPKMLAILGVATAGGAATWILSRDAVTTAAAAVAAGTIAALGARAVRSVSALTGFHKDQRYRIDNITDRLSAATAVGELDTQRLQVYLDHIVPDKARQKAVRDWLEGDDTYRNANPLSALERAYADAIELGFKEFQGHALALGLDQSKLIERYLTHIYVPGVNTNKSVWANLAATLGLRNETSAGMSPHSRFTMKRSIPTYKDAEALGLMPVTNNPAEILRIYANNVNQALQNKLLIDALVRERTPWGERMMVVDMSEAAMREVMRRDAIFASQLQMTPTEKKILQDMHASIRAPAEFVTINHPQMRGYKVHPDIAPVMKHLFDTNDPNIATRAFYAVSIAAKRGLFSYSLFHAKSLMDALLGAATLSRGALVTGAIAGGVAAATGQDSPLGYAALGYLLPAAPTIIRKARAGKRAVDDITAAGGPVGRVASAQGALNNAGGAGVALRELVAGGLRVTGRPLEGDVAPFARTLDMLGTKYPVLGVPAKAAGWVAQKMNTFLWDYVHPSFKAAIALQEFEKQTNARPNVPREQIAKEVASYSNDVFGSVDWFKISDGVQNKVGRDLALAITSPSGRRFLQIAMLAPDWTVSTARSLLKAIPGVTTREIGAMHRAYFMRSALLYATIADGFNMLFSGHHFWENDDTTMVELADGRRMQLSKHFMESIHWLQKPGQQALNKLGYVPAEMLKQALNTDYLSVRGAPKIATPGPEEKNPKLDTLQARTKTFTRNVGERVAHAGKGLLPITGQQLITSTPAAALSGFVGAPIYGKTEDQAVQDARVRAEREGRDVGEAERRTRRTYQKKQKDRDAKHR